jgi:hypothetical protein
MSSGIYVAIKIDQQCLKDYIIAQYGEEPIQITAANKLSSLFVKRLAVSPPDHKPVLKSSPGYLIFELPYNDDKNIRYNCYINEKKQRRIIEFFESEFKFQFRMFMNENLGKTTCQQQDTIYEFTRTYNIDCSEDTYELLKKDYYRYRVKLKKPLLKIRGAKTYKKALLKKNISTTLQHVLSPTCP